MPFSFSFNKIKKRIKVHLIRLLIYRFIFELGQGNAQRSSQYQGARKELKEKSILSPMDFISSLGERHA